MSCKDDDAIGGFGILIGNDEMQMNIRFVIEHGDGAVTCDDFKGTLKVQRGFTLLGVKVEGAEFYFTKSAEEFEGSSLG